MRDEERKGGDGRGGERGGTVKGGEGRRGGSGEERWFRKCRGGQEGKRQRERSE